MASDAAFAGTVAFSLTAGVLTFFAPCAYPLLPGYVGYYLSREDADPRGAVVRGLAAALGALVVLAGLGAILTVAGRSLVARLGLVEPVVGAALVVLGASMLVDRVPTPTLHVVLPQRRSSIAGFALFGGVYAVAAAGCVVPVVFGVVTQALALPIHQAAVALTGYAVAVALPLAAVTLLAALGSDLLGGATRYLGSIRRLAAVVVILAGLWQIALSLSYLGVV